MSLEQQMKKYTEAEEINFEKMLGQGGIKFYEFKCNDNGFTEMKTHIALPITIEKIPRLYEILDEIDTLNLELKTKLENTKRKLENLKDDNIDELTEFNKEMRNLNRTHNKLIIEKKLEIALLCFERTEKTTIEELRKWITSDILERIEYLAFGITFPPKD